MKTSHLYDWKQSALHGMRWYQRPAKAYCGYTANPKVKLKPAFEDGAPTSEPCELCRAAARKGRK